MDTTITQIVKTLGSFRAENLGDQLFNLYTRPVYFAKLLTRIPCLLQGGRGTGKTTVLKSLSYEGQYRLSGSNFQTFDKQEYLGLYYKLETGLVSAFSGAGKKDEFWRGLFSYFINLQLSKLICEVAIWYEEHSHKLDIDPQQLQIFCKSISLESPLDLKSIKDAIEMEIANLESDINYASDSESTRSMPIGGPPRRLIKALRTSPELKDKIFYFLFDEYENLFEYQQAIINTFVKQADSEVTFKIGIRELGLKTKKTLNPQEQLVDPADYVLIDVARQLDEKEFDGFAKEVIGHRFEQLKEAGVEILDDVEQLFEDLSEEQEASKLGGDKIAEQAILEIKKHASKKEISELKVFNNREIALMQFFSQSQVEPIYKIFKDALADSSGWNNRVNNYGYAALFSLRTKKVGISKYYSGWKTFLSLSAGNIRYLLQLVTNSLIEHVKEKNSLTVKISAKCQTEVAAEVGKKNLLELEGLSTRGAQLMKLVLGLGQVFHEMALQPYGHAPEITQFEVSMKGSPKDEVIIQVNDLLQSAVMHLALVRTSGTKLGSPGDTRDFDYMLHPIFSPFFIYSHRRKRKFSISAEELLGLISSHSNTIKSILSKQNRVVNFELPEQLQLFGGFYERNS